MGKQTTNQNLIPLMSREELRHLSKDELIEWGLALQKQVAELQKECTLLREQKAILTACVEELEQQLRMNSRNSSKLLSSDPPQVQRPKKESNGHKPGGQPGHERHLRQLLPCVW